MNMKKMRSDHLNPLGVLILLVHVDVALNRLLKPLLLSHQLGPSGVSSNHSFDRRGVTCVKLCTHRTFHTLAKGQAVHLLLHQVHV